jgi:hypothetical protein
MTQTNPTDQTTTPPQDKLEQDPNVINLEVDVPVDYDVDELKDFMDLVFSWNAPEDDDAETLVWATATGAPGFPRAEGKMFKGLARMKRPQALYFGTSTCKRDDKGNLFNRKSLFRRLHVVVLDDIGTKVPLDTLPKELEPTYIIESSEGNFQYGYVLETPIDVLEHAEALIQLVYESGYSDTGGMMPTKLVRLPGGINGKMGEKKNFNVRLTKSDGPLWTPQNLLRVMDLDVQWDEVMADTEGMVKRRASRSVGTSPWSPIKAQAAALGGIVDPVLEWLYDREMVMSETDEWVQIECPWKELHSKGGEDTAGYSPLGRGQEHEERRGFHCFHGHCKDRKIGELLAYVAANGGPEAPVFDPAARLVADWAYDNANDSVWQIQRKGQPRSVTMAAFRNSFPRKVQVYSADGKMKSIPETALWMTSPGRVMVAGQTFNPTDTSKIVAGDGDLYINMFSQPEWGDGAYDQQDIKMFTEFLDYLLPSDTEREYFTNWLAAKCQNLGFRGAAILMIAKQQGTGRTTLADMIEQMIGTENVENVPFARLTGDAQWNDWMEKPLIVTNETKDTSEKGYYKVYESLKEYIDPRPKRERINPKYGQQRISMVHSSYLMFSNHDNALAVAGNDRRFYVMRNATVPATPSYFTKLNEWLEVMDVHGKPKWARSVWRWLQEREVDIEALLAPAPNTTAKDAMINASKSPLQVAIETIVEQTPGNFVATYKIKEMLRANAVRLNLHEMPTFEYQVKAIVSNLTTTAGKDIMSVEGKRVVPKLKLSALMVKGNERKYINKALTVGDIATIRHDITSWDVEALSEKINEALDILES